VSVSKCDGPAGSSWPILKSIRSCQVATRPFTPGGRPRRPDASYLAFVLTRRRFAFAATVGAPGAGRPASVASTDASDVLLEKLSTKSFTKTLSYI